MTDIRRLEDIARTVRYLILKSTTTAGSGHPTSSLSAVDLMCGLLFGGAFRYDVDRPDHPNNDRMIFSKGHAAPLLYALWVASGKATEEEAMTLRRFDSPFEGHPTSTFRYAEAATGSLGQGLSIGLGMALNARYIDELPYKTYVLLGDSEMTEGSQWEAVQLARHYRLDNLVGILDVNRLGQRGETLYGHDLEAYRSRLEAFGWQTRVIDGHDMAQIVDAFRRDVEPDRPLMIIARTLKGRGVSFLEDRDGWHGKALDEAGLKDALEELEPLDPAMRAAMALPEERLPERRRPRPAAPVSYSSGEGIATRKAYGRALARLCPAYPDMVVLDAEVSNSTYSEYFKETFPERFFEMYVAEQNMVGAACGLAIRGKLPFVSTFSAFFSRAFDQIRMSQYAAANIKFCGSHAGVAIGPDGPSQMGLEDIAMFRTLNGGVVLYPSDAVSTEKLVEEAARFQGPVYIRTTRNTTPVIYSNDEEFPIGGCKVLRRSDTDRISVVAAGITLHEALKAYETLKKAGISIRVIDLYCIKPLDVETLRKALQDTGRIVTVEDHYPAGGIGEAVAAALSDQAGQVCPLAVGKMPKSGTPEELLRFEGISSEAIVETIRGFIGPIEGPEAVEEEICTKAPEWAEHERFSDSDQACDDGRAG
ncbi:MAG: transketolase [Desulfobacterales bacterium]